MRPQEGIYSVPCSDEKTVPEGCLSNMLLTSSEGDSITSLGSLILGFTILRAAVFPTYLATIKIGIHAGKGSVF